MTSEPSMDIEVDRGLQERTWLISRIFWAVMLTISIVALVGLTGSGGPLSRHHAATSSATLDIPRVARWGAIDHLTVKLDHADSNEIEILVPKQFGEIFSVESVSPEPSSVTVTRDGHLYEFDASAGAGERSVVFSIRASHAAWASRMGRFEVNGEPTARLPVLVLP